jgi:hypothetical protein
MKTLRSCHLFQEGLIWLSLALLTACLPLPIYAQTDIPPAKKGLLKELMELTQVSQLLDSMFGGAMQQADKTYDELSEKLLANKDLKETERDAFAKQVAARQAGFRERLQAALRQQLNPAELIEQLFYPLYDKYYEEAELKDLIAFYRSPTGQKTIRITPQLLQESMQKAMEVMLPKMMPVLEKFIEEEKREIEKLTAPAPPEPKPKTPVKKKRR